MRWFHIDNCSLSEHGYSESCSPTPNFRSQSILTFVRSFGTPSLPGLFQTKPKSSRLTEERFPEDVHESRDGPDEGVGAVRGE